MRGWRILTAVTAVVILIVADGCHGFFVDPVLTGMTVGPPASLQTGTTVQMSAVGTYNDGSVKNLDSGVYWSSATPAIASVNTSGVVKGLGPGQAIISGSSETVTGSATVTVTLGGLTSIKVTTADGLSSIPYGSAEQFVATGMAGGQEFDITNSVTWSTNPASVDNVSISSTSGLLISTSGPSSAVQFLVIATDPTTGISGQMNFNVHP
jgi:hypothetical protein